MAYLEHCLVVLACTLSGGVDKVPWFSRPVANTSSGGFTCGRGSSWVECDVLDADVQPHDVLVPWYVALFWLIFLGMPTLLLHSKHKDQALAGLAWMMLECLSLMLCSFFGTDHPAISYALSMHSCARLLSRLHVSDRSVGGRWWWRLRFVGVAQLLAYAVLAGVPVSIVRWKRSASGDVAVPCAYLAHLAGCIAPDLALTALRLVGGVLCSFCSGSGE